MWAAIYGEESVENLKQTDVKKNKRNITKRINLQNVLHWQHGCENTVKIDFTTLKWNMGNILRSELTFKPEIRLLLCNVWAPSHNASLLQVTKLPLFHARQHCDKLLLHPQACDPMHMIVWAWHLSTVLKEVLVTWHESSFHNFHQ